MLDAEVAALEAYRSPTFTPQDNGVRTGWYYYLGPYDPPFLPRPSLVTSVLSESLFVSNAADLEALKRADVRQSIAAGIYIGLAEWLNATRLGRWLRHDRATDRGGNRGLGHHIPSAPDQPGEPPVGGMEAATRGSARGARVRRLRRGRPADRRDCRS